MIYNSARLPIGVIEDYAQMNGNSASKSVRHLNNNRRDDRFAYRKEALYCQAKRAGPVYIK